MLKIKGPPDRLPALLQKFFMERLQSQQAVSVHTVASYRDTFRLLLAFIEQKTKRPPSQQRFQDWSAQHVLLFLNFLEKKRHCGVRTRNSRLAAIRAFMRYVAQEEPGALALSQAVLAIPMKRFDRLLIGYLSRIEVEAILAATDPTTPGGRRDHLLLSLLYNTGARVSEILTLQRHHIRLQPTTMVEIMGKGRKQRSLPLWKTTGTELKGYLDTLPASPDTLIFTNRFGHSLSRFGVGKRLRQAVQRALSGCPSLKGRCISPHMFRHSTAMHLLQAKVDITVIALLLGHESPSTTHHYIQLNMQMKEQALSKLQLPGSAIGRFKPTDSLLAFLEKL